MLAESRDLDDLRARFGARAAKRFRRAVPREGLAQQGLTRIPRAADSRRRCRAQAACRRIRRLHDDGDSVVAGACTPSATKRERRHPRGVRRLLAIALADKLQAGAQAVAGRSRRPALLYAAIESAAPRAWPGQRRRSPARRPGRRRLRRARGRRPGRASATPPRSTRAAMRSPSSCSPKRWQRLRPGRNHPRRWSPKCARRLDSHADGLGQRQPRRHARAAGGAGAAGLPARRAGRGAGASIRVTSRRCRCAASARCAIPCATRRACSNSSRSPTRWPTRCSRRRRRAGLAGAALGSGGTARVAVRAGTGRARRRIAEEAGAAACAVACLMRVGRCAFDASLCARAGLLLPLAGAEESRQDLRHLGRNLCLRPAAANHRSQGFDTARRLQLDLARTSRACSSRARSGVQPDDIEPTTAGCRSTC